MSIGGHYFSELEGVLMFGFWIGVPVLFVLGIIALGVELHSSVSRGTTRWCALGLFGVQMVIVLGYMSETTHTAQFWNRMLLLYIVAAPVILVRIYIRAWKERARKSGA